MEILGKVNTDGIDSACGIERELVSGDCIIGQGSGTWKGVARSVLQVSLLS